MEKEIEEELINRCQAYNDEIFAILNDFTLDKETRDNALNEVSLLFFETKRLF